MNSRLEKVPWIKPASIFTLNVVCKFQNNQTIIYMLKIIKQTRKNFEAYKIFYLLLFLLFDYSELWTWYVERKKIWWSIFSLLKKGDKTFTTLIIPVWLPQRAIFYLECSKF